MTRRQKADWIAFTAAGDELRYGQTVCARKPFFWFSECERHQGDCNCPDRMFRGTGLRLTIRQAARDYRCADCGQRIDQGDMHGGTFYEHYCLNCVIPEKSWQDIWVSKWEETRTTRADIKAQEVGGIVNSEGQQHEEVKPDV